MKSRIGIASEWNITVWLLEKVFYAWKIFGWIIIRSDLELSQLSLLAQRKCLVTVDTKFSVYCHWHSRHQILMLPVCWQWFIINDLLSLHSLGHISNYILSINVFDWLTVLPADRHVVQPLWSSDTKVSDSDHNGFIHLPDSLSVRSNLATVNRGLLMLWALWWNQDKWDDVAYVCVSLWEDVVLCVCVCSRGGISLTLSGRRGG